ncbi:MAG: hypothetical protein IKZ58_08230 [Selenomonadaceae bacterium]|nr:hypothetical protein [Selenomonadaceae bacterium]
MSIKHYKKFFSLIIILFVTSTVLFNFSYANAKSLDIETIISILSTEKGKRPNPETYLSKSYISNHLRKFNRGVSLVMGLESYNKYVVPSETIGRADGCFVMPRYVCDEIEKKFNGDISVFETSLSFNVGYFSSQGGLVRIDVFRISDLNLRMASGNEAGANSYWLPGGFTMGGIPEAVVDPIPKNRAIIKFYK